MQKNLKIFNLKNISNTLGLAIALTCALGSAFAPSAAFSGEEQKFTGTWHNQYGSEMRIVVDSQGRISGKYHSAVGRKEVTADTSWFDVVGFVNGDVASFVVSWGPQSGAISAWSGHFVSNKDSMPQIKTLTHTSLPYTDANHWQRTVAGNDVFSPGSAK